MRKGTVQLWVRDQDGLLIHNRTGGVDDVDAAIAHVEALEVDEPEAADQPTTEPTPPRAARKRASRNKK